MELKKDIWHYPRTELAQKYVDTLNIGLSSTLALFAPRRMGKTEFLRRDLTPAAEKAGYWVIYASLWEVRKDPGRALINEIQAHEQGLLTRAIRKIQKGPKITVGGGFAGAHASMTIGGDGGNLSSQDVVDLGQSLRRLAEGRRKVLLLIDEVQTLADDAHYGELVAALRSALNRHSDRVKAIFTGSSQEGLRSMFNREKAPLYQFGQQLSFPVMGEGFVQHLLNTYSKITKRKLELEQAWKIFNTLKRVPLYFRSLLENMVLTDTEDMEQALQNIRGEMELSANYQEKWEQLRPMDRAVLMQIQNAEKPYGEASRQAIDRYLGVPERTTKIPAVQQAIKRLSHAGILTRAGDRGVYSIEDPMFGEWIQKRQERI